MKKLLSMLICLLMVLSLTACSGNETADESNIYTIGICNYVDDASLNQIVDSIKERLNELSEKNGVTIKINEDNANADANVLSQIVSNFIADEVDLMIGVATPVALNMQGQTEDNPIPVVFAAVSDPLAVGLVESLEKPGANITGTSDYLDTNAVLDLMFVLDPEITDVGLLYDVSQDASTTAIRQAKEFLNKKGVTIHEKTGTNVDEIRLAVGSLINEGVSAVFTPSDNTVMTAELSIYEDLANAKVLHFAGADSFALNGAFLGYGVDYANLGKETAEMAFEILVSGKSPAEMPVKTFDNGIATVNTEICELVGLDYSEVEALFAPLCSKVQPIQTAEYFGE
ncbi:MAG: ABC transporter substrate-binding protein [Erysipelotrichaceae bacterium]|nr:ABC transporter substrate-binding protein [Erysipelotrichaceae bacterium]